MSYLSFSGRSSWHISIFLFFLWSKNLSDSLNIPDFILYSLELTVSITAVYMPNITFTLWKTHNVYAGTFSWFIRKSPHNVFSNCNKKILDHFFETTALAKNNFHNTIYLKTTMCKFLFYIQKKNTVWMMKYEIWNTSESDKTFFFIELYSGIKL